MPSKTRVKNGLEKMTRLLRGVASAILPVNRRGRFRAAKCGRYLRRSIVLRTFSWIFASTVGLPLRTRETVAGETPAWRATSRIPVPFFDSMCRFTFGFGMYQSILPSGRVFTRYLHSQLLDSACLDRASFYHCLCQKGWQMVSETGFNMAVRTPENVYLGCCLGGIWLRLFAVVFAARPRDLRVNLGTTSFHEDLVSLSAGSSVLNTSPTPSNLLTWSPLTCLKER